MLMLSRIRLWLLVVLTFALRTLREAARTVVLMPGHPVPVRQVALACMVGSAMFISQTGCWGSTNPCDAVMPVVVTTQTQLADVQRAIAEVERSGIREQLPEAKQKVFDNAMTKVKDGYDLAVRLNALVQTTCEQAADMRGAMALIIDGWHVVRGFLALFGGKGAPPIADPVLYSEAVGQ